MTVRVQDLALSSIDLCASINEVLSGWESVRPLTAAHAAGDVMPTPLDSKLDSPFTPAIAMAASNEAGPHRAIALAVARAGRLELLVCDSNAPANLQDEACQMLIGHAKEQWGVFRLDIAQQDSDACSLFESACFEEVARSIPESKDDSPVLHMMLSHGVLAEIRSGKWANVARPENANVQQIARQAMHLIETDPTITSQDKQIIFGELLGSFGPYSTINPGAHIDYGCNLFIGQGCFFNFGCTFLDSAPIIFEDEVMCGPNCTFATPLHPLVARERAAHRSPTTGEIGAWERALPITIKRGAWLASNVTVNPGVTIGEGAVIGSGSVVTKDIPANVLAFGTPCHVIREITDADCVGI